jgi:hypothetical protein
MWGCRDCWRWLVVCDDLRRAERFAELLLYIALVILYDGLLLDILSLLLLLFASLLIFMPSYPPEIGLLLLSSWMLLLAAVSLAVVLVVVMMTDVSLQTPSQAVLPFPQALLRSSASLTGWNCPIFLSCLLLRNDVAASFFFSFCSMSCWAMSNCCLLFHVVMTHPKLDAEPYQGGYGIVFYDTEPVTFMHHGENLIL